MTEGLIAAILAGGASERMGTDKAELRLADGSTLLDHTIQQVQQAGMMPVVIGRTLEHSSISSVPDDDPGCGPLGGLLTALRRFPGGVTLLGCDQPLINAEALHWLSQEAAVDPERGLATKVGEQWQPLFSVYRGSCLAIAERRLAERRLTLRELLTEDCFRHAQVPTAFQECLINVNTPEDFQRL